MYRANFILYVENLKKSREFYERVFAMWASTDEPEIKEFVLGDGLILGLRPAREMKRMFGDKRGAPTPNAAPRTELYVRVWYADLYLMRAEAAGGKILSKLEMREWGEEVGYAADLDGNILAFAKIKEE
jgi:predicted enzyme related to lactoylglutathione lyase